MVFNRMGASEYGVLVMRRAFSPWVSLVAIPGPLVQAALRRVVGAEEPILVEAQLGPRIRKANGQGVAVSWRREKAQR